MVSSTRTISVGLHDNTSCPSFAPAALRPLSELAWLKRLSTGSFDAGGSFPCGKSGTKFCCMVQCGNLFVTSNPSHTYNDLITSLKPIHSQLLNYIGLCFPTFHLYLVGMYRDHVWPHHGWLFDHFYCSAHYSIISSMSIIYYHSICYKEELGCMYCLSTHVPRLIHAPHPRSFIAGFISTWISTFIFLPDLLYLWRNVSDCVWPHCGWFLNNFVVLEQCLIFLAIRQAIRRHRSHVYVWTQQCCTLSHSSLLLRVADVITTNT